METLQIYTDLENPQKESAGIFRLKNEGKTREKFSLGLCPRWLDASPQKVTLDEGQECQVRLVVQTDKLGGVPYQEDIVAYDDETAEAAKEVKVQLYPWPQITVDSINLTKGKIPEKILLAVQVAHAPFRVRSVKFSPAVFFSEQETFLDLGKGTLPVSLLLPENMRQGTLTVAYQLSAWGLAGTLNGKAEIHFIEPATIIVQPAGTIEVELIPDDEGTYSFTLTNRGDEVLQIEKIEIVPAYPEGSSELSLKIDSKQFPVQISGKTEKAFELRVDSAGNARSGNYPFSMQVQSNALEQCTIPIAVTIVDEECPEPIAIDYGTTDSAVAYLPQRRGERSRPVNIFLNIPPETPDEEKIYSNIFFMGKNTNHEIPYLWCIGNKAKNLGAGDSRRFVKAIKTKVGKNYREKIVLNGEKIEVPAEEIVKFIYMDLLKRTWKRLKQRPVDLLISIPTRFSLDQKIKLQEAFEQARRAVGLETTLSPIAVDESLAAGLFYIAIRAPKEERFRESSHYSVMVVDFGGGTTDVTLLQVNQEPDTNGGMKVTQVEILGAWGDEQMGGEGITREIARLLATQFLGRSVDEQHDSDRIRELETLADDLKLTVSGLMTIARKDGPFSNGLPAIKDDTLKSLLTHWMQENPTDEEYKEIIEDYLTSPNTFSFRVDSPYYKDVDAREISVQQISDIYQRKLEALKQELFFMLKRKGIQKADVVLLAGQSSLFPLVGEVLQELAHVVDYVKDEDGNLVLKECVSRGALLFQYQEWPIVGQSRLWTRLGRLKGQEGKAVDFEDLIPWGEMYPYETRPFDLRPREVRGQLAFLDLLENFTLDETSDRTVRFCRYEWDLKDSQRQPRYQCKLQVNELGQIRAFCQIGTEWKEGRKAKESNI